MVAPYYTSMVNRILAELGAKLPGKAAKNKAVQDLLLALFAHKNKMKSGLPSSVGGKEVKKITDLVESVMSKKKGGHIRWNKIRQIADIDEHWEMLNSSKEAFRPYWGWWEDLLG